MLALKEDHAMKSNADEATGAPRVGKRAWTNPSLNYVGRVGDVLQGGGGKLSPVANDPGDTRKPQGQG